MIYFKKIINGVSIALGFFGFFLMLGVAGKMEMDSSFPFMDGVKLMVIGLICFAQGVFFHAGKGV